MAEIVGTWIIDPDLESLLDDIKSTLLSNLAEMFGLALDEAVDRWGSGGGYDASGEEVNWDGITKKGPPVLLDTGNLIDSLELVLKDDGYDAKFDITSTAEVYGRKGGKWAVHPKNVSIWNDHIPHKNVPKGYRVGSEAWDDAVTNSTSETMNKWINRGSIRPNI